jgi:HAD superfamily hydrolase (TIGR01509 family)
MKSVFFGSIGAVAETSEFQRQAYNQALEEAGLSWHWDAGTYRQLLNYVGGKARLRLLANATGQEISDAQIDRIHARKTEIACAAIVAAGVPLRPGVAELAKAVKSAGGKLGFVSSTSAANIDAIFALGHGGFSREVMDTVIGREDVSEGKPAPNAYLAALNATGLRPGDVVAVEDTPASALSAKRAGLEVVLTPGAFAAGVEEAEADLVVDGLASGAGKLRPEVERLVGLNELARG